MTPASPNFFRTSANLLMGTDVRHFSSASACALAAAACSGVCAPRPPRHLRQARPSRFAVVHGIAPGAGAVAAQARGPVVAATRQRPDRRPAREPAARRCSAPRRRAQLGLTHAELHEALEHALEVRCLGSPSGTARRCRMAHPPRRSSASTARRRPPAALRTACGRHGRQRELSEITTRVLSPLDARS